MRYFKNTELAKIYNVSEKSVRNWINAAKEGKLDLQLFDNNGRLHIANVTKNTETIEKLVANGKKYKNSRGYKVVTPSEDFYNLYSKKQILDIVNNIDIFRESPIQYTYFNGGVKKWDRYVKKLSEQSGPNSLNCTVELIESSREYTKNLISNYSTVNIFDIGVGNGMPIKGVIKELIDSNKMGAYVGIDISPQLLDLSTQNISKWFGEGIKTEKHVVDVSYERFGELIASHTNDNSVANIIYFLGGTISNFREPDKVMSTIHDSMGKNDLLIITKKIDTQETRRYFEMTVNNTLDFALVLKLLGITDEMYQLEVLFDEKEMTRKENAVLSLAVEIEVNIGDGNIKRITLNKGDKILLWRARHESMLGSMAQLDRNGFHTSCSMRSLDNGYMLSVSKLRTII